MTDSVGAEATFIAGIVYCMSRGYPLLTTLKFAWEMTVRKLTRIGIDGLANSMSSFHADLLVVTRTTTSTTALLLQQ